VLLFPYVERIAIVICSSTFLVNNVFSRDDPAVVCSGLVSRLLCKSEPEADIFSCETATLAVLHPEIGEDLTKSIDDLGRDSNMVPRRPWDP
jgi:hypothetical protein